MPSPYEAALAQVDRFLAEDRTSDAYRALGAVFSTDRMLPARWFLPALQALARVSDVMVGPDTGTRIRAVIEDPSSADTLYKLGWALIEQGAPSAAVQVLLKAEQRQPGHPRIIEELVTAYADLGQHASAVRVMQAHPSILTEPMLAYLLTFNAIMAGDLQSARDQIPGISALEADPEFSFLASTVVDMLSRYDAARPLTPLHESDLIGWHFVTTGGLLLHTSPHGEASMRGRYAFVQDSLDVVLEGLRGLELCAKAWRLEPEHVWYFPDPHSHTLAIAAAELVGGTVAPWTEAGGDGLVVAYDLTGAPPELLQPLRRKQPSQLLFQHAACWTRRQSVTPDVCSFVYQFLQDPWHEQEDEAPHIRAAALLDRELHEQASRGKGLVLDLAMLDGEESVMATGRKSTGWRPRFWGSSPVRSARFA